jgi:spore coat assembly protein
MEKIRVGDIVGRKSYDCDVFFKVSGIRSDENRSTVDLKGINCRLEADAPAEDLEIQSFDKVCRYIEKDMCREAEIGLLKSEK